jgi:hypothetical protein
MKVCIRLARFMGNGSLVIEQHCVKLGVVVLRRRGLHYSWDHYLRRLLYLLSLKKLSRIMYSLWLRFYVTVLIHLL